MQEVDDLAHNLHAVYRLTERCRAIVATAKTQPSSGLNLVLVGEQTDFEAAIEMTTDFELMNSVCQAARIYPGDDPTVANLRRARILDAMLAGIGRRPVFSTLSEAEALVVGNEFVNLLIRRFGHADAVALVEGEKMMDAAGIAEDIEHVMGRPPAEPIELTTLPAGARKSLPPLPNQQRATS